MSGYEIAMICITSMTFLLKLIEVLNGLNRKERHTKATAYCRCAVAL